MEQGHAWRSVAARPPRPRPPTQRWLPAHGPPARPSDEEDDEDDQEKPEKFHVSVRSVRLCVAQPEPRRNDHPIARLGLEADGPSPERTTQSVVPETCRVDLDRGRRWKDTKAVIENSPGGARPGRDRGHFADKRGFGGVGGNCTVGPFRPLTREFSEWAILVSNQWPLPCEGTRTDSQNPVFPGFSQVRERFRLTMSDRHFVVCSWSADPGH